MAEIFLTSDQHYSHVGITKFLRADGTKLRPWDDVNEMNEALIENHNRVVGPKDRIYFLGDVAMNNAALPILDRLNGIKVLIKGNHDEAKISQYIRYFKDIRAYHVLDRNLLAHIPVHPDSKSRFVRQIHGHLHDKIVKFPNGKKDPWYQCVCVEQTDWSPISYEVLKAKAIKETEMLASEKDFVYNLGM